MRTGDTLGLRFFNNFISIFVWQESKNNSPQLWVKFISFYIMLASKNHCFYYYIFFFNYHWTGKWKTLFQLIRALLCLQSRLENHNMKLVWIRDARFHKDKCFNKTGLYSNVDKVPRSRKQRLEWLCQDLDLQSLSIKSTHHKGSIKHCKLGVYRSLKNLKKKVYFTFVQSPFKCMRR